jgi:hypothetical protein
VNVSFAEVPGALQNGIVGAITGEFGLQRGLVVSTHLLPIPWRLGPVTAMNLSTNGTALTVMQSADLVQIISGFEPGPVRRILWSMMWPAWPTRRLPTGEARSMTGRG